MRDWSSAVRQEQGLTLQDVHEAPGHLIRRCQQISVAIFADELRAFSVTSVQYAALVAIRDHPGIDQKTLVRLIAIDRSTVGNVLQGLEARAFVMRITPAHNQRIKQLFILPAGSELIAAAQGPVARVQERLLAPLDAHDKAKFLQLLTSIVDGNNVYSRAPLMVDHPAAVVAPRRLAKPRKP